MSIYKFKKETSGFSVEVDGAIRYFSGSFRASAIFANSQVSVSIHADIPRNYIFSLAGNTIHVNGVVETVGTTIAQKISVEVFPKPAAGTGETTLTNDINDTTSTNAATTPKYVADYVAANGSAAGNIVNAAASEAEVVAAIANNRSAIYSINNGAPALYIKSNNIVYKLELPTLN